MRPGPLLDGRNDFVRPEHLQAYLDEFVFRFNRRSSRQRGLMFFRLLEASVAGTPVRYARRANRHGAHCGTSPLWAGRVVDWRS